MFALCSSTRKFIVFSTHFGWRLLGCSGTAGLAFLACANFAPLFRRKMVLKLIALYAFSIFAFYFFRRLRNLTSQSAFGRPRAGPRPAFGRLPRNRPSAGLQPAFGLLSTHLRHSIANECTSSQSLHQFIQMRLLFSSRKHICDVLYQTQLHATTHMCINILYSLSCHVPSNV